MNGVRIRWLMLGATSFVLAVPIIAALTLRLYETYLVRQTERQLIAQSVVIAEAWREAWLSELGASAVPAFRPPARGDDPFIPIEPRLDLRRGIGERQSEALPFAPSGDSAERRAGARIEPLLKRMQVFNLSAARVLDGDGCVVATTRSEGDRCLAELPEVASALSGQYASIVRERMTDDPLPPLSDVRSRGSIRIFTALPIFSDGRVVGVVRMSRTSLDALTSLWHARRGLLVTLLASLAALAGASLVFAALIARPVTAITSRAEAVARGGRYEPIAPRPWIPHEIRRLGEALDTMTQKLEGRAQYVAELAANVSHELKSPVTAIRGAAELLRDQWPAMSEAQRQRFIANIDADAARMETLVARLLELARIENAPAVTEPVLVRAFFAQLAERYGDRVTVSLTSPPPSIAIRREHLEAAVFNLVDNALRYGGAALTVSAVGERLSVRVTDCGPGISAANQARLFQRFFTTEREHGGTGLGLSIVKAVADARGGSVTFTTGPTGTTFTLLV